MPLDWMPIRDQLHLIKVHQKRKVKLKKPKKLSKGKIKNEKMLELSLPRDTALDVSNDSEYRVTSEARSEKSIYPLNENKRNKKSKSNVSDFKEESIKVKESEFTIGKEYTLLLEECADKQDYPRYRLTCHLCNYNTDKQSNMTLHLNGKNHRTLRKENDQDMMLPILPEPLSAQIEAINDVLTYILSCIGLENNDIEKRNIFCEKLKIILEEKIPTCSIEMIGSSATGVGFKDSAVDFILKVEKEEQTADFLEEIHTFLSSDKAFSEVLPDFKKKRPSIHFYDLETKLFCNILVDSACYRITKLLRTYFSLDCRARALATVVNHWASTCDINQQDRGTLPSFSYGLLVIHFLQQVQPPVLPVLHELTGYSDAAEFYDEYISKKSWQSENIDSLGELWLKFFHFYNFEYKIGEDVISIRSSKRLLLKDKNWSTRFYAIEDPFTYRNLAYVIPSYQVCAYIQFCFLKTYKYFAFPQLKWGQVKLLKTEAFDPLKLSEYSQSKILCKNESEDSDESDIEDYNDTLANDLEDHDPDIEIQSFVSTVKNLSLFEDSEDKSHPVDSLSSSPSKRSHFDKSLKTKHPPKSSQPQLCYWDISGTPLIKDSFTYAFNSNFFRGDKRSPVFCKNCKRSGHFEKDCPSDNLPSLIALPKMTQEYLELMSKVLHSIRDSNCVGKSELDDIERDKGNMEKYIKEIYPCAQLTLFGSFLNGFGFKKKSDMDLCLTFSDCDGIDLDSKSIIGKVAGALYRHSELTNVIPITSAKVPIVKFSWAKNDMEGDISLYNTLAIINTEMLEAYSKIDSRVQILGYALKYFAKTLGICDASRGSLSSYAYILMVIFYLQQRNPPVIPVLQELHTGDPPCILVDGCNVWFYRDIDKLKDVWPEYGKNVESVAELWVGLFRFYSEDFNWKEHVISIKQKKLLSQFKKVWNTFKLAIEDPFDLDHNLGAGLSKKMNSYILKAFIRGRECYGSPVNKEDLKGYDLSYLFNRQFLNDGCEPPHDRGCSNCGKIGHIAKNCLIEKTCLICRLPGHVVKNCPRRNRSKKSENDKQKNYDSPERSMKDKRMPQGANKNTSSDHMNRQLHSVQPQHFIQNHKFAQSGIPGHRHPPPGFFRTPNPPPGFMFKGQKHIAPPVNFPPPFQMMPSHMGPPFPQNQDMFSKSPPKHYAASPPKNFGTFPDSRQNPGLQMERLPNPARLQWLPRPSHPILAHGLNPSLNMENPMWKSNAKNVPYNSSHPTQRW